MYVTTVMCLSFTHGLWCALEYAYSDHQEPLTSQPQLVRKSLTEKQSLHCDGLWCTFEYAYSDHQEPLTSQPQLIRKSLTEKQSLQCDYTNIKFDL